MAREARAFGGDIPTPVAQLHARDSPDSRFREHWGGTKAVPPSTQSPKQARIVHAWSKAHKEAQGQRTWQIIPRFGSLSCPFLAPAGCNQVRRRGTVAGKSKKIRPLSRWRDWTGVVRARWCRGGKNNNHLDTDSGGMGALEQRVFSLHHS